MVVKKKSKAKESKTNIYWVVGIITIILSLILISHTIYQYEKYELCSELEMHEDAIIESEGLGTYLEMYGVCYDSSGLLWIYLIVLMVSIVEVVAVFMRKKWAFVLGIISSVLFMISVSFGASSLLAVIAIILLIVSRKEYVNK